VPIIPASARRAAHPTQKRSTGRLSGCLRSPHRAAPVPRLRRRPTPRIRSAAVRVPAAPRRLYLLPVLAGLLGAVVVLARLRRRKG